MLSDRNIQTGKWIARVVGQVVKRVSGSLYYIDYIQEIIRLHHLSLAKSLLYYAVCKIIDFDKIYFIFSDVNKGIYRWKFELYGFEYGKKEWL